MRVGFTGHRPNKLYGYKADNPKYKALYDAIFKVVHKQAFSVPDAEFVSGMALGADTLFFEACLEVKNRISSIRIISAVPYMDQPNKWVDTKDINKYYDYLDMADEVVYVDTLDGYQSGVRAGIYHEPKLFLRDRYMVDTSDKIVSVWNPEIKKSGTFSTILYALAQNKRVLNINPVTFDLDIFTKEHLTSRIFL